ncbi:MAG: hypothetical protein ACRC42_04995 [Mycoplasma sp.]
MKISTLIKSFTALTISAVVVSSAVIFGTTNNITVAKVSVFTKKDYERIAAQQSDNILKNYAIDYSSLPKSNLDVSDLISGNVNKNEAFIFSMGSEANIETNLMLHGINEGFNGNTMMQTSNSVMSRLYEKVFVDNELSDFNLNFYSYIDTVNTRDYLEADALLHSRKKTLGNLEEEGGASSPSTMKASRRWKVLDEKGKYDEGSPNIQPVVKGGEEFSYKPDPDAYYEFRKDDKHDTEYEKIYYRNDEKTRLFKSTSEWFEQYTKSENVSIDYFNENNLVLGKYNSDGEWTMITYSTYEHFTELSIDETVNSIIEFFEESEEEGEDSN